MRSIVKLYNYQKAHVKKLLSILQTKRGALDLSATGTGKTICALSVAKALDRPVAVVCPLAVIPGWERTAKALDIPLQIVNYESLTKARGFLTDSKINVPKNALVIYDEAHRCKNYKTGNAKNMLRIARAGYKILALSATIAHHAEHLRAWNEAFNFTNAPSFSSFMYTCGYYYESNKWGGAWLPQPQAMEKTKRAVSAFSSGMTIEDAHEMFKSNSVSVEVISSKEDAALARTYAETFKALRAGDKKSGGDHLTRMLRARQASEIAKLDYITESVRELVDEGFSVVVFCNFNATVDALLLKLNELGPAIIRGGQTAKDRERERLSFQKGKTKVILCNLASGGVGLDLHDTTGNAPRFSLILPSWSAVEIKQALGRVHRAGAKTDSVQKLLYSDVPVERRIAEVVREKLTALDTLHDSETDIFGGKEA